MTFVKTLSSTSGWLYKHSGNLLEWLYSISVISQWTIYLTISFFYFSHQNPTQQENNYDGKTSTQIFHLIVNAMTYKTSKGIDWLIDWGLTPFSIIFQSYHGGQFTYSCVSWLSHTSNTHNNLSKQLAAFPHRLLAHWWKTNDACHNDFC